MFGSGGGAEKVSAYTGSFKVSLPEKLSRVAYVANKDMNARKPQFTQTSENFANDLKRLPFDAKTLEEIKWAALQMSQHYVWPASSMEIFHRSSDSAPFKTVDAQMPGTVPVSASELGLGEENGVAERILRSGRAVYIPDTSFTQINEVILFPVDALQLILESREFEGEKLDPRKEGWEVDAFAKAVNKHSRSMFIMPLSLSDTTIGLFVLGNRMIYFFGEYTSFDELQLEYLIGDSVKLALGNLQFPSAPR